MRAIVLNSVGWPGSDDCRDLLHPSAKEMAMRRTIVLVATVVAWSSLAAADTSVHVGVGTPSLQFDFLYSDYGMDRPRVEREISYVPETDLLVALHLARISGVDLDVIVGWRRNGMSWDTITRRCHRDARAYYVMLPPEATGPPYGRAHGYWKKHGRCDLQLTDVEIRELVLVQVLATHCKMEPAEVVRMRAHGSSPRSIASAHENHDRQPTMNHSREDTAPNPPAARGHGRAKDKSWRK
jgi:hypothetical protein